MSPTQRQSAYTDTTVLVIGLYLVAEYRELLKRHPCELELSRVKQKQGSLQLSNIRPQAPVEISALSKMRRALV